MAITCHRCSGQITDAAKSAQCATCECNYHTYDCGKRIANEHLDSALSASCPRCDQVCTCKGGLVMCHSGKQRMKRDLGKAGGAPPPAKKPRKTPVFEMDATAVAQTMPRIKSSVVAALLKCTPTGLNGRANPDIVQGAELAADSFCQVLWNALAGHAPVPEAEAPVPEAEAPPSSVPVEEEEEWATTIPGSDEYWTGEEASPAGDVPFDI